MKPYNLHGIAGLAERTKHPDTGCTMSLYVAEQAGLDADETWVAVCETHDSMVGARSRAQGRESMENPEWCEECVEMLQTKNARGIQLAPGQTLETLPVLAGAYRGRQDERSLLTHAVICSQDQFPVRALCSQRVDHVTDIYGATEQERTEAPTCSRCRVGWDRLKAMTPNHSAVYYVWLLDYRNVPIDDEGPYGPMSLDRASAFARIGAQEGEHDRAVSIGVNPEAESFEIVRRYRRDTGERII